MINATSSKSAPWYIIPADHKWVARALVSSIISRQIRELNLRYPEVSPEQQKQFAELEHQLEQEHS